MSIVAVGAAKHAAPRSEYQRMPSRLHAFL